MNEASFRTLSSESKIAWANTHNIWSGLLTNFRNSPYCSWNCISLFYLLCSKAAGSLMTSDWDFKIVALCLRQVDYYVGGYFEVLSLLTDILSMSDISMHVFYPQTSGITRLYRKDGVCFTAPITQSGFL